jgi:hypothetical protein
MTLHKFCMESYTKLREITPNFAKFKQLLYKILTFVKFHKGNFVNILTGRFSSIQAEGNLTQQLGPTV